MKSLRLAKCALLVGACCLYTLVWREERRAEEHDLARSRATVLDVFAGAQLPLPFFMFQLIRTASNVPLRSAVTPSYNAKVLSSTLYTVIRVMSFPLLENLDYSYFIVDNGVSYKSELTFVMEPTVLS